VGRAGRGAALLALGGVLLIAACGDDEDFTNASCGGSVVDGSKRVSYLVAEETEPPKGLLRRTERQLCERTAALGIEDAVVRTTRDGQEIRMDVFLPPGSPILADEMQRAARLRFYDWEANIVGDPLEPISLAEARAQAEEVPGAIVIHAEPPDPGYYVIRNRPVLRNEDIRDPRSGVDEATGEATISFDFTSAGSKKFQQLTRGLAVRAEPDALPHFAVVVDAELVALPTIDTSAQFQEPPPGVTMAGRIGEDEADRLTDFLAIGHLRLDLASAKQ
jgi:preprotein translocase subunit SecD